MSDSTGFEQRFFSGQALYGDDFAQADIDAWFADEEHGYAGLVDADNARHGYGYEALNRLHGFGLLAPDRQFRHALGFGSSYGDELLPVAPRCQQITLLDASSKFAVKDIGGVPVNYLLATPTGDIRLPDASVDLITCFGVLHHIPNVSKVLQEFRRVLAPDGVALIREPITTMGDWRQPRAGLTRRERGIPRSLFLDMVRRSGFDVVSARDCQFPPLVKALSKLGRSTFSSALATQADAWLSSAFRFNYRYHRGDLWSRFAPGSLFVTARCAPAARA
jgi:SAM-dependent methyltransferase